MGGGSLWRSVARAVGAAAPTVAVTTNAAYCHCAPPPNASPRSRGASCKCKAVGGVHAHPGLSAVSYGPRQFWDGEDWEIAGDEERDYYVFGSLPTVEEVEEASSDLQNALRIGFFTPPPKSEALPKPESSSPRSHPQSPRSPLGQVLVEVTEMSTVTTVGEVEEEVTSNLSPPPVEPLVESKECIESPLYEVATSPKLPGAPSSAMLEAFYQFQHNPQVQGMVVSLATDKAIWDAVLSNEKIKEFRRNFSAPNSEDSFGGGMNKNVKSSQNHTNVFSQFFWKSKKAFTKFVTSFQDFVTSLFETVEKKSPVNRASDEKTNFFERTVKASFMFAVMVLAVVIFKRSAVFKRG